MEAGLKSQSKEGNIKQTHQGVLAQRSNELIYPFKVKHVWIKKAKGLGITEFLPKCNQGKMRPAGKTGTDRSINDPFSETSDARRYECDNCGHIQFNAKMTESLGVGDSVSASVEKNGGSYEKGLFP